MRDDKGNLNVSSLLVKSQGKNPRGSEVPEYSSKHYPALVRRYVGSLSSITYLNTHDPTACFNIAENQRKEDYRKFIYMDGNNDSKKGMDGDERTVC